MPYISALKIDLINNGESFRLDVVRLTFRKRESFYFLISGKIDKVVIEAGEILTAFPASG
jgi:hypothetical protein